MSASSSVLPTQQGRFKIADFMYHPGNVAAINMILGRCTVKSKLHDSVTLTVEYMALCDDFDSVVAGETIPQYEWIVTNDQGQLSVKAVRQP